MLDLEAIKRRSGEASKNRQLTQLRDGLAILDDSDALIAEVERLRAENKELQALADEAINVGWEKSEG